MMSAEGIEPSPLLLLRQPPLPDWARRTFMFPEGVEPPTPTASRSRSTAELRERNAPGRSRTYTVTGLSRVPPPVGILGQTMDRAGIEPATLRLRAGSSTN